jgi:predicted Zn-dependent protease with MMP-like domain
LPPEPDFAETQELRSILEDVFEELPDPVLKLVANAPIKVQARPTIDQVRAGLNPRAMIGFIGKPKQGEEEAELEGIVVMRDIVLEEVEDEEELPGELFYALMEELQYFFKRDDIVMGEGS